MLPRKVAADQIRKLSTSGAAPSAGTSLDLALLNIWTSSRIIRLALLEGAAFLGIVVFFQIGSVIALVTALVMLAAVAIAFPTRGAMEAWLDEARERYRGGAAA